MVLPLRPPQPPFDRCALSAQAQLIDQAAVTLDVLTPQILEKAATPADHPKKASAGMVVFGVSLQVLGKLDDPPGQDRNLYFRRASVSLGARGLRDDLRLIFFKQRHARYRYLSC